MKAHSHSFIHDFPGCSLHISGPHYRIVLGKPFGILCGQRSVPENSLRQNRENFHGKGRKVLAADEHYQQLLQPSHYHDVGRVTERGSSQSPDISEKYALTESISASGTAMLKYLSTF